jgi:two-component system, chemotaxis family, CheB/CheR fusion protein
MPLHGMIHEITISLRHDIAVFDRIKNGIIITDENSIILYCNPGFTQITGYTSDEAVGENITILRSGRHNNNFYQQMQDKILREGFWEGEIWNRRKSGQIYPELLTISKLTQAKRNYYIGVFSDITFLEEDVEKKLHLAFYDPLTELPNRHLYFDRARHALAQAEHSEKKPVTIAFMDLDNFKEINDQLGHDIGDKVLKIVGERLTSTVRANDTIARIGGDEFTAILNSSTDKTSATRFAKRIIDTIEQPFILEGHTIKISMSIGLSFYPTDSDNINELLKHADQAMYIAKRGPEKIVCYSAP